MTTRQPNEKRGEKLIEIGGEDYILRFPFAGMQELKEKLGKSVLLYLKEVGENLDFEILAMIIGVGLKYGGNPLEDDKLLEELDVAHVKEYSDVLGAAFGNKQTGEEAGEENPSIGTG